MLKSTRLVEGRVCGSGFRVHVRMKEEDILAVISSES